MSFTVVAQAENSVAMGSPVTSVATSTTLNLSTNDRLIVSVFGETQPTSVTDTAGNTFNFLTSLTPQTNYSVYIYEAYNAIANAADTVTATYTATKLYAVSVLQLRGLANSGAAAFSTNSQGNVSGTNAITGLTATPASAPAALLGFSYVTGGPTGKTFVSTAGTGFTAQTGVWGTSGGGAGFYIGCWESMEVTNTSAVAATWTQTSNNQFNTKGSFTLIIPEASSPPPTVSSVNGGSSIIEGTASVVVVGTNFASGMTATITQPGGISVAQPFTFVSAASGHFNLTMEPGSGNQLAFTDATYVTNFQVTVGTQSSAAIAVTLIPLTGDIFETLSSVNSNSSFRITATPDLASGDQLEASGNVTGTLAVPTGLTLNSDATWQFAVGDTPANFYVRAYSGGLWGAWAQQNTTSTAIANIGWRNLNVFELSSITGLVPWVSYIPVQFPAGVAVTEYDRVDPGGAITCNILSSVTGLTPWVNYIPIFVVSSGTAWRTDPTGYIPMVQLSN